MKKLISIVALGCMCLFAVPAGAQLKFGVRAGANFSDLHIKDIKTNTATGWFVGPTAEFLMPVVGLGLDASLLYSRVNSEVEWGTVDRKYKLDYLSLPVNIKYKLGLPLIKPFIYAGPELCARINDNFSEVWAALGQVTDVERFKSAGTDVKMNIGGGVELFDHLEIFVNYNVGFTNTVRHFDSKTKMWRVGGTFYF